MARAGEGLAGARTLFLEGYYDRAVAAYRALSADPATALAAHLGWADVDEACGRYREALDRLQGLASEGERSSAWHAARAALHEALGDYNAAIEHNRRALQIARDDYRARWQLGRLLEMLGRRDEALETYKWFDRQMRERLPDRPEDLTFLGRGFLRYTVLTRHERLKDRAKHVLQEVFQEAYEFVDDKYWPARAAAAELLLEKHNLNEAVEDFQRVLKINDKATPGLVGLARAALERWDFDTAERRAEQALEVNPNSCAALAALARLRMLERKYDLAAKTSERMLAVNPRSVEGLSILAAAQVRGEERSAAEATIRRLEAIVPKSAVLHQEQAVWLSAGRQYAEAEAHFKQAIEFDPTWSEPRTQLGLMLMQSGNEPEARRVLEASWQLDPFNQETFNTLELLDELERFARHDIEHFTLLYDAKEDGVIVPYFADRLATLHADVTRQFEHAPARKTDIEVFPTHSRFSVRITGRPWIATVGACTGPVIALQAPRKSATFSTYNWARTLRHEYTHTVTLAATENRIPHWMTEGMAVYAETAPRPWPWIQLLADAIRRDDLASLKSIDWRFQRPRRRNDRTLAYAQSEWMIEYITERWGFQACIGFLKAFRDKQTQEQAFRGVCRISTKEFDRDFAAWARKQAEAWGVPLTPYGDEKALRARLLLNSRDAAALAQLAELRLRDQEFDEARKLARDALKADAKQVLALKVMSGIQLGEALSERSAARRGDLIVVAAETARRLHALAPDDPETLLAWGIVQSEQEQWDGALPALLAYQQRRPLDPESYRRIGGIYLAQNRPEQALPALEKAFELADDEPLVARKIAELYERRGAADRAAAWLERSIEIDPYDVATHRRRGRLYEAAGELAKAATAYESMCVLEPDGAEGHGRLAGVLRKLGRAAEADRQAKLADERGGWSPTGESGPATTQPGP